MKKFNSETGVTLVEILIGVVISMIMMSINANSVHVMRSINVMVFAVYYKSRNEASKRQIICSRGIYTDVKHLVSYRLPCY